MTESELAKTTQPAAAIGTLGGGRQPPPSLQLQQHQQQQIQLPAAEQQQPPQQQQRVQQNSTINERVLPSIITSSLLLQPNFQIDPVTADSMRAIVGMINSFESNYQSINERYGKLSQEELLKKLEDGNIKEDQSKHIDGIICGILTDPANAEKYMACLKSIINEQLWRGVLFNINILLLELYPYLRKHCHQQLIYFFDHAMRMGVPTLDHSFISFCRALSDGTEFRDTALTVHKLAQTLLANQKWMLALPRNTHFSASAFALFSRFISDTHSVAGAAIMAADTFKQPLISICEFLIRERFCDLMMMGSDLVLTLMRFARLPQFMPTWRSLLHNPTALSPKLTGVQQLLVMPTQVHLLHHRVSLRISRKMAEILKIQVRNVGQQQPNNNSINNNQQQQAAAAARSQQQINRLLETLRVTHMSGPDSGSIRAEMLRHMLAMVDQKLPLDQPNIEARAMLLGWLLRTAKAGSELQWCKLVFFWEWYGFEPTAPNAVVNAEPILSTIRHLFAGSVPLCNSLIDFLIKSSNLLCPQLSYFFTNSITSALRTLELAGLPIQPVLAHSRLDQSLRDQLRTAFPDLFPKRMTSIANTLAEPSQIIDFDAIRNTTATSASSSAATTPTTPTPQTTIPTTTATTTTTTAESAAASASSASGGAGDQQSSGAAQSIAFFNGKGGGGLQAMKQFKVEPKYSMTEMPPPTMTATGRSATKSLDEEQPPPRKVPKMLAHQQQASGAGEPVRKKMRKAEGGGGGGVLGKKGTEATLAAHKRKRNIKSSEEETEFKATKSTARPTTTMASSSQPLLYIDEGQGEDKEEETTEDEEQQQQEEQGPSQRIPLAMLLPTMREEFREPLESLDRAVRKRRGGGEEGSGGGGGGQLEDEEAIEALQNLVDSIFDADDMDTEQTELIALCLLRIFDSFLQQKHSYFPADSSEESMAEAMEQPLFRFLHSVCRAADNTDTRRSLLAIVAKMLDECSRLGYLLLFFTASIAQEGQSGRGDSGGPTVKQAASAYKDICAVRKVDWEKQLAEDLERCSFDDYPLYSNTLVQVLNRLTPYGPPARVMRLICSSLSPQLLSRLMSEIVRENIVLFAEENVLQLLTDSLKWESLEQIMLWQLVQTEAVEFDKFMEILQRLSYARHPEAIAAIIVILRNMEPNPGIRVMKPLLRFLLLRPPKLDLFTVDAIKLLIDYDENIPSVADCISKMVKKAIHQGDITAAGSSSTAPQATKGKPRVLTVDAVFAHLDRLRQNCMQRESQNVEGLLKNALLLDMVSDVRRNQRLHELHARYDELFTLFDIFSEGDKKPQQAETHGGKQQQHRRKAKAAKHAQESVVDSRDGSPVKRGKKRPQQTSSSSSSDEDED